VSKDSKTIEQVLGLTSPEKMSPFMMKVLRYRRVSDEVFPVSQQECFSLGCTCLGLLVERKKQDEVLVLSGLLVICREKLDRKSGFEVLFTFALSAFESGDGAGACSVMRTILLENNDNDLVWEFFNIFLQKTPSEELQAHKFLLRSLSKLPDCAPLQLMLGNHSQSTVWFDHAISQYLSVLREKPDEPLASLLLAASYLSKAYVRTQQNPRRSVLCSYAAMKKYAENRGDFMNEVLYNWGKFYQALKMYGHAEKMYRLVLEEDVDYMGIVEEGEEEGHVERFGLKRDAAYNLWLILRESNPVEAGRVMRRWLCV
jgi:hypothetical protein